MARDDLKTRDFRRKTVNLRLERLLKYCEARTCGVVVSLSEVDQVSTENF
jgi:hypothetical protein